MEQLNLWIGQWLDAHGLWAAVALVAAESAGLPCPLPLAFLAVWKLAAGGQIGYWPGLGLLLAGKLFGAGLSYYAGRAGDNALSRRLSRSPRMDIARARLQDWYERRGAATVFFSRLVGQLRPFSSFFAGLSGVPPTVFWAWTIAGSALYVTYYMWVVRFGFALWDTYPHLRQPVLWGAALACLVAIAIALARRLRPRRRATPPSDDPEKASTRASG